MHKREENDYIDVCAWFAMIGILSGDLKGTGDNIISNASVAEESYQMAEAMLRERQKRRPTCPS